MHSIISLSFTHMDITPKDLTKAPPRSPHTLIGGFKILGRTIDKCRATIAGTQGEYHFDCPVDNQLFSFMGIKGADFKDFVAEGHTDEEIVEWIRSHGKPRTDEEIADWNQEVAENTYQDDPEKAAWLAGEVEKAGMPAGTTLFNWLDEDDKQSFKEA
jgi:hypothetical protein